MSEFDGYFYLSMATIVFGGIGLITRYAYRSKCSQIECCCIKIKRDIEVEEREDALVKSSPSMQL